MVGVGVSVDNPGGICPEFSLINFTSTFNTIHANATRISPVAFMYSGHLGVKMRRIKFPKNQTQGLFYNIISFISKLILEMKSDVNLFEFFGEKKSIFPVSSSASSLIFTSILIIPKTN